MSIGKCNDQAEPFVPENAGNTCLTHGTAWIDEDPTSSRTIRYAFSSFPMRAQKNPYKKPDRFTVAAKKAGFPARSVFKLEEIDRRVRLFRQGMTVLDLGAAPGSWAMYAAQKVGGKGHVFAVDLTPLNVAMPKNVSFRQGDAFEDVPEQGPFDVVLSDMAPNTTGVRFADQSRSFDLFMRALAVAEKVCKPGGSFVGKIFMGEDLPIARAKVRELFTKERLIRPEGTRANSYELFVIGEGRRDET